MLSFPFFVKIRQLVRKGDFIMSKNSETYMAVLKFLESKERPYIKSRIELFNDNQVLLKAIVNRFSSLEGISVEDLEMVAVESLLRAIDGFSLERDKIFSTYAEERIIAGIIDNFAEISGMSWKEYTTNKRRIVPKFLSPFGSDYSSFVKDPSYEIDFLSKISDNQYKEQMKGTLNFLADKQQQQIVNMRLGLDGEAKSFSQIAEILHIEKDEVESSYNKALIILKTSKLFKGLQKELRTPEYRPKDTKSLCIYETRHELICTFVLCGISKEGMLQFLKMNGYECSEEELNKEFLVLLNYCDIMEAPNPQYYFHKAWDSESCLLPNYDPTGLYNKIKSQPERLRELLNAYLAGNKEETPKKGM